MQEGSLFSICSPTIVMCVLFGDSHSDRCEVIQWLWFAFPWWLVRLSIFSCGCWPSVFPLWENVYSALLPSFQSHCLIFRCWVIWAIYNLLFKKNFLGVIKPKIKQSYQNVSTNLTPNINSSAKTRTLLLLLLSCFSHVRLFATPWTAAHQAPLSTGFSRQDYWRGYGRKGNPPTLLVGM